LNPQTAYWLQQALNALQLGSIYALIALGYSMVYGTLSMINFAHGDVFMVGAFLCFLAGTALGLPFFPTLLLAMCGAALLGVAIERLAYKPLRNAPRVSAIITALGVGLFLENLMLAFYPYPQNVPRLLENVTWHLGGVSISSLQVVIIGLSLALMLVLDHVVHRPHGFLDRGIRVGTMAEHQIDVVELQALQRSIDGLPEILAVQRVALVWKVSLADRHAPVKLGRHDILAPRPRKLLQHRTHDLFALSPRINLGVIEKIDAGVVGSRHQLACRARIDLIAVRDPGTKRKLGNF